MHKELGFKSRQALVKTIIDIINDELLHDHIDYLPEDWNNVDSWSDEHIKSFVTDNEEYILDYDKVLR